MNKLFVSVISLGFAGLLGSILFSCQGKPGASTQLATNDSNKTVNGNLGIVYVNSDTLLSKYELFKEARAKMEEKAKQAQVELQAKGTAFQREVADYQKNAPTMSAEQRQTTEERLARKQNELSQHNQNASASLQQDEAEENQKLYTKVSEYLKKYSKEKGYKYVLTYSATNPALLYADQSLEITTEVVKGLNEEYKQEKK
ncbi:periplasmic chaperone for outer membrane proteins Skp [bacterium A37T11]|nr:periplasmic chaperone for outer membrane proteins Skp [bacterium A37T11]